MKAGFLALATFAMATSASAATTNDPFVQDKAVLNLEGLDLATVDGQERLAIRMDAAARAVCGDRLDTVHLAVAEKARECRTAVLANIRDKIETRMAADKAQVQLASAN